MREEPYATYPFIPLTFLRNRSRTEYEHVYSNEIKHYFNYLRSRSNLLIWMIIRERRFDSPSAVGRLSSRSSSLERRRRRKRRLFVVASEKRDRKCFSCSVRFFAIDRRCRIIIVYLFVVSLICRNRCDFSQGQLSQVHPSIQDKSKKSQLRSPFDRLYLITH